MFHTTHHIQKRDLLLGCWTKVTKYHNPLWTRVVIAKHETLLLEALLFLSVTQYLSHFVFTNFAKLYLASLGSILLMGTSCDYIRYSLEKTSFFQIKKTWPNYTRSIVTSFNRIGSARFRLLVSKDSKLDYYEFNTVLTLPVFAVMIAGERLGTILATPFLIVYNQFR